MTEFGEEGAISPPSPPAAHPPHPAKEFCEHLFVQHEEKNVNMSVSIRTPFRRSAERSAVSTHVFALLRGV